MVGIQLSGGQKFIRPGESHNVFIHQISVQSNQWFVCKCMETAEPISGHETAGIQQRMPYGITRPQWVKSSYNKFHARQEYEFENTNIVCKMAAILSQPNILIQLSVIIIQSSIVRFYINNYRNWGRISIRCWIHKRHPIPRPNRRAMGVFCECLCENWPL